MSNHLLRICRHLPSWAVLLKRIARHKRNGSSVFFDFKSYPPSGVSVKLVEMHKPVVLVIASLSNSPDPWRRYLKEGRRWCNIVTALPLMQSRPMLQQMLKCQYLHVLMCASAWRQCSCTGLAPALSAFCINGALHTVLHNGAQCLSLSLCCKGATFVRKFHHYE